MTDDMSRTRAYRKERYTEYGREQICQNQNSKLFNKKISMEGKSEGGIKTNHEMKF
jgi:hypothetical protein